MSGLFSVLLLRGKVSRLTYGLVAVPILLVFQFARFLIGYTLPLLAKNDLAVLTAFTVSASICVSLLIVPLLIVSFNRLHDIGLTGFLSLPILLKPVLGYIIGYYQAQDILYGTVLNSTAGQVIMWLSRGLYVYGLGLAVLLLLVPARKPASVVA